MPLVRDFLQVGVGAVLATVIMLAGSLLLWVGVPLGWIYLAAQVQAETGSVGLAIVTALAGAIVSIIALAAALRWLDQKHQDLRRARGAQNVGSALEKVMVLSAGITVIGFTIWFLGFAGPGPSIAPK